MGSTKCGEEKAAELARADMGAKVCNIRLEEKDNATEQQLKNLRRMKEEVKDRYFYAPDLQHVGKTAYRKCLLCRK
ncbi:hypothetical protein FYJ38_22240 [Clostridium sp. WB02_MRS01]|uniref:hypothetical protein n=1 Tax=Clostridium sp. WB02_MRS01 TaxID=2605777 RepID=UPI0012B259B4|nr:hypothetical protein [Clostridium sp. WB02_MRS01]MSS11339.1 hypothetical protein [Clostridium sp. WB02_MRS01]